MINLTTEQLISKISELKAGERILLSGTIYTARDAAHARIAEMIARSESLPVDFDNTVLFYCGPSGASPCSPVGACGPTTSSRMDPLTPMMIELGVKAFIGKGDRSRRVKDAMRKNNVLYLAATGGIAALLSTKVKSGKLVAFEDLGPEAIYKLEVKDFPVMVAFDTFGGDVFSK
jgi:fumarate hydratase subunit beta